jgi:transposase
VQSGKEKPDMSRPQHNYSTEFRQQAVDLLISSGRPLKRVAVDLGVSASALRLWRTQALSKGRAAKVSSTQSKDWSEAPVADAVTEIRRLHRENEYLRRQREILKKAVSILSEEPQSGMP